MLFEFKSLKEMQEITDRCDKEYNIKTLHETPFKDIYVTVNGEVVSWKGKKDVIELKPQKRGGSENDPYYAVNIGGKLIYVHRLVAMAFNGVHAVQGKQVNHLDNNHSNNALYNLEVCGAGRNHQHRRWINKLNKTCGSNYRSRK